MSAVTDAKLIIETLIGRTLTAQQLTNIADKVVAADPAGLTRSGGGPRAEASGYFADPDNPTNEEKAQLFLDTTKIFWRRWLGQGGAIVEKQTAQAAIVAAAQAAEAELD